MSILLRHRRSALALFCLALWLPGFFTLPPSDRDESRFAQATKQMVETGNYVRIMNGTEARNRKPIGIYWLQAPFVIAARDLGLAEANPIWPYRMPALLGGILAVLATEAIGTRLGGARAGLLAGAMLASCVVLTVETHIAKTDAALLGATTVAMAVLARAYLAPRGLAAGQAALFWVAMAAGILLKGPITPMVAGLAALSLAVADRRGAWLARLRPLWGIPLMLVLVLPWVIAIERATRGQFLAQAVGGDLASKLVGGDDAHGAPPGYYVLLLSLLAFPSGLAILRALPSAWAERRAPATRFLIAWALPSWIVFALVPTKLPHYTLPLYPALCLLAARHAGGVRLPSWWRGVTLALFLVAALVLGVGAVALPLALRLGTGEALWLGLPGFAAAALVAWLVAARQRLGLGLIAMVLLYGAVLGLELPRLGPLWLAPRLVPVLRGLGVPASGKGFVVAGYDEPSLMFLAGTDTDFVPSGAAAAAAMSDAAACVAAVSGHALAAFEAAAPSAREERVVTGFNYSRGRWVQLHLFGTCVR